ncbi:hypothetical protein, partial [Thomasclavelia spiroformis]|uniref:hypothetical protein n=1 Tax=Thomasclavelia spiroformis TaxID=29348 RepID=UPI00255C164A
SFMKKCAFGSFCIFSINKDFFIYIKMADNPFVPFGVGSNPDMQNLVDQAVVLNTALVPKLPEINIVDGMVPIIDQVFCDSGSPAEFSPGTTINFNFGNHKGKLIDWTQSRLCFDCNVKITVTDTDVVPPEAGTHVNGKFRNCSIGSKKIRLCLRHGAMVFSQVTVGGAGRPITVNDFEMCALAKSLFTTCESNIRSRTGEITTHDFPGCSVILKDIQLVPPPAKLDGKAVEGDGNPQTYNIVLPVSIPVTSVLPLLQNVDNYLNSVTTGIELRLTVSANDGIFCFTATEPVEQTDTMSATWWQKLWGAYSGDTVITNKQFYKRFQPNPCRFAGVPMKYDGDEFPYKKYATHRMHAQLVSLQNVRIDMISTEHPDDNITTMLSSISIDRGLFYPHQMYICTPFPFNITDATKPSHHNILVPLVSGYNNLDTMFIFFTKRGDYSRLKKLPIKNLYTSLNGTYKTPIHNYRDVVWENMTECAHQFNRAFGTSNSSILAPMQDIMDSYLPCNKTNIIKSSYRNQSDLLTAQNQARMAYYEMSNADSFVTNCTIWELEKSSWMSGPDLSNYNNKYQIVFDLEPCVPSEKNNDDPIDWTTTPKSYEFLLWICQRCDCYTHIKSGYMNLLTSKKEVALALASAIPRPA